MASPPSPNAPSPSSSRAPSWRPRSLAATVGVWGALAASPAGARDTAAAPPGPSEPPARPDAAAASDERRDAASATAPLPAAASTSLASGGGRDQSEPGARAAPWYDPFALDLTAATWVPLSVGPEASIELPGRALLQLHVGWMPELYSQTLTRAIEDAGALDAPLGALVDGAVRGATTWRVAAGWRPLPTAGLELTLGYAHVAVDGRTHTDELVPLLPPSIAEQLRDELGDASLELSSSIHHLTLAAGWRWLVADRVVIRANLGYLHAVGSSSTLDSSRPDLSRLAQPTVQSLLHEQYMRHIRVPVLGLGVGYRFF